MNFPRSFVQSSGLALAVALLGGCTSQPAASTPAPASAPSSMTSATAALSAPGDVAPGRLFSRQVRADMRQAIAPGLVSVSNPISPRLPLEAPLAPETWRSKSTTLHVAPGSAPTELVLPVDVPEDAWVFFIPKGTDAQVGEDVRKDVSLYTPRGRRVDPWAERAANLQLGMDPAQMREKVARPISMLRLDREMGAGAYKVLVGARAAQVGLAIEIRLPASPVELALTSSAMQFFPGEDSDVTVGLTHPGTLDTVRFEASLYNPRFERDRVVPVEQVGGEWRARVSRVLTEQDESGVWVLEVRAVGTADGKPFDRLAQTAVGFVIPTARITAAGGARAVRDGSGKVSAFEVDVTVESQARDRYEVTGTLVAMDRRGLERVERPVAEAQVTDQLGEGSHTLTLRFDAGHVGLSGLDGTYTLRGLRLYSLGNNALYHRLGKGLEVRMPAVSPSEFAAPELTPALEQMMQAGDFSLAR